MLLPKNNYSSYIFLFSCFIFLIAKRYSFLRSTESGFANSSLILVVCEKLVKYLFKNGYVDYLGTDIHHSNKDYTLVHMDKIIKKIKKITGEEYFMEICNNCSSLVEE